MTNNNTLIKNLSEQIVAYTKELRLPAMRKGFKEIAGEAAGKNHSYEEFLFELLESEYLLRLSNRKQSRIRMAGFPAKKHLEDIDVSCLPDDAAKQLNVLSRLDFIENAQNIILAGNPGTGKTHLATALGMKACMMDYKVLFTTIPRLLTQIRESRSQKTLRSLELKFENYDLVICDEFGYISFDKEGAELLFTHLSLRTGKKSTIITTNLTFDRWKEIFGDPVLTAAMVDRLTHKAILVNMNGSSYRAMETKKMYTKKNK